MVRGLEQLVAELALAIGVQRLDLHDGHARWELYRRAIETGQRQDLLLDVVGTEPDQAVALSLVLAMLERTSSNDRISWASKLSTERNRKYALRRAAEISVLESCIAGALDADTAEGVPETWSDWLQLRLAKECSDKKVLHLLAERGNTNRIRRHARERISSSAPE